MSHAPQTITVGTDIDLADRAGGSVRRLHAGERHTVILAAMVAMFLSRPGGLDPDVAPAILEAVGPPAPQLRTALRAAHIRSPCAR